MFIYSAIYHIGTLLVLYNEIKLLKMKKILSVPIKLCLCVLFIAVIANCSTQSNKDISDKSEPILYSVLDRQVHLNDSVIWEVPVVPRLCEQLEVAGKKINIGDCNLYVEEEGSGEAIVLLHGGPGSTHHGFHPAFSEASEFARIIYYDQRGCGLSDYEPGDAYSVEQAADDLDKLREKLGIKKWIVLGHSYGGFLAQYYTTIYPENVSGLIIVCGSTGMHKGYNNNQYSFISNEERNTMRKFGRQIRKRAEEEVWPDEKTMALTVYNNHINGDWKRQSFYRPKPEAFARVALYEWSHDFDGNFNSVMSRSFKTVSLKAAFKRNPIPTLIMESLWDMTWDESKAMDLNKNHPEAKMLVFSKSAHSPFEDEPELFFNNLEKFITGIKPVKEEQINKYKEYLNKREVASDDPLIVGSMSDTEENAINELIFSWKKSKMGKNFLTSPHL